jgi:uncharacterized protein (TIGR03437 family)
MKWMFAAALLLNWVQNLEAQVTLGAAVNAASYLNPSLPNGNLTQGGVFIVFGTGLGPSKLAEVGAFPLPTTLAQTSISATVGGTTVKCIMLYTSATQVAAVLPSNTPLGTGTMVATYNGVNSTPLNITVSAHDFGIFALNQGGSGAGVITNAITYAVNSSNSAANPGDLIDIWGTGLGPVAGDEAAGPLPGNIPNLDVQVLVGGQSAKVMYAGRSGCCTGLDQIEISVPSGVYGCTIPVYFVVAGVVSNFVTMAIAQSGSTCSDPGGLTPAQLQSAQTNGGLRVGSASLSRFHAYTATVNYESDSAAVGFSKVPLAALQQGGPLPRANSCYVVQFPTGINYVGSSPLAAGTVTMSGPIGPYTLVESQPGTYDIAFSPSSATAEPGLINDGTLLTAGNYTFTGTSGKDIGAFNVTVPFPSPFQWTNRLPVPATVNRSQSLTITWSNGYAGALVYINGQSQVSQGVGANFTCWADAGAGKFTVPAAVLSAVPPTYSVQGHAQGSLDVYQVFLGPAFSAPGIDLGSTQFADGFDTGPITYK